jgi:hypothetical protein
MNRFTTTFWLGGGIVAIVLLLLMGTFAGGQTPPPDRDDVVLGGFLGCHVAKDSPRECPFRLHYVNLVQGRTYHIRMESTEFDPRLILEDLAGNLLAGDTDWFDALPGCIVFRPPTSGSYRLVASAAAPMHEGYYTITLRELPVVMRVEAALTTADEARSDCYHRVFEVTLTAGRRYIMDLESNHFETFVKLLNPGGAIVAFDDEGCSNRPARIVFEAARTGTYRLVATSGTPAALGAFTLTVCEE